MRFGKSFDEVLDEAPAGGSGDFLRNLKRGDTRLRFVGETDDTEAWVGFKEHNLFGIGIQRTVPCTGEADCPGCNHPDEKVQRAARKIAVKAIVYTERDGKEQKYLNIYRLPVTLGEKLRNRASRRGTITDRDYVISKFKTGNQATDVDYDLETEDASPLKDAWDGVDDDASIEDVLRATYEENVAHLTGGKAQSAPKEESEPEEQPKQNVSISDAIKGGNSDDDDPAPWEKSKSEETEKKDDFAPEFTYDELAAMDRSKLRKVIEAEIEAGRMPEVDLAKMLKREMLEFIVEHAE